MCTPRVKKINLRTFVVPMNVNKISFCCKNRRHTRSNAKNETQSEYSGVSLFFLFFRNVASSSDYLCWSMVWMTHLWHRRHTVTYILYCASFKSKRARGVRLINERALTWVSKYGVKRQSEWVFFSLTSSSSSFILIFHRFGSCPVLNAHPCPSPNNKRMNERTILRKQKQ